MIGPFNDYGYDQRVLFESIPTQRNAEYTKPRETVEHFRVADSFFSQKYGVSPNIAHICAIDCPETAEEESSGDSSAE